MSKLGLVLEGGGMRGAYTAGCLAWMIEHDIMTDYGVGISMGALHLCTYYLKDTEMLHKTSVDYMSNNNIIGLRPLMREGRYVGYDYVFEELLKKDLKYDTKPLTENKTDLEIGLYDMNDCQTVFFGAKDFDDDLNMVKAACVLPIAGNIQKLNGKDYLDGGITVMIPIERALEAGCDKNIVIVTKPAGYVRKPAGVFMKWFMKANYPKHDKMVYDYTHRHENYNRQMALIADEVEKGKAVLIRPSQTIPVKRFSGDPENLQKLYELGYQDMENQKEEIFKLIGRE